MEYFLTTKRRHLDGDVAFLRTFENIQKFAHNNIYSEGLIEKEGTLNLYVVVSALQKVSTNLLSST